MISTVSIVLLREVEEAFPFFTVRAGHVAAGATLFIVDTQNSELGCLQRDCAKQAVKKKKLSETETAALKLTLAIREANPFCRFFGFIEDAFSFARVASITVETSHTDFGKNCAVFVVAILVIRIWHDERTTWYPCHVGFKGVNKCEHAE